jgi:zinc protease
MLKKFQLKNGLTVVFVESHRAPVVSMQMWVRTGSADEGKGEEGISHFIEHLVFKGSRKFGVGEISSLIEGSGGELNAYTSFDQTVFYITISKHFLQTGLVALAEMMGFPKFDPAEIEAEREVVVEEIKRGQDSLGRRASQLMFSTAYKKHPYCRPVIGYEKNVRSWSAKKIVNFYHSKYVPKNMFLLVSGNIDPKTLKPEIEKIFGEIKSYTYKKSKRAKEVVASRPRFAVEQSKFQQSISYLTWPIPNIFHKDIPALDVLSVVLGQGDSSRLIRRLRIDDHIVNSVSASLFTAQDPGLFAVSMGLNPEKTSGALPKVAEEIIRILQSGVTQAELERAVTNLESEQLYSMETVDGLSRQFGNSEFLFKDLKSFDKYIRALRQVKAADVLRVAKKYLIAEKMHLSAIIPENHALLSVGQMTQLQNDFVKLLKAGAGDRSAKKPITAMKKSKLPKPPKLQFTVDDLVIEQETLENGVDVIWVPQRDTHVVSAKAVMRGGLRNEPDGKLGLVELLGRTWLGGTSNRSEMAIAEEIETLASGISPIVGRNTVGLGLETLSHFQKQIVPLFFEVLTDSTFPKEVMERERSVQLEQIRNRKDNPSATMMRKFNEVMFAQHPYSRDQLGTEESLMRIKQEDLLSYWTKIAQRKNMAIVVSGNYDRNIWIQAINQSLKKWSAGQSFKDQFSLPRIDREVLSFEHADKEQSHLMIGFPSFSLHDPEKHILEVIQSILAGQGGRLFLELRDKNSLAYSVSPMKMEGIEGGFFGAYIGCSPDKVKKALEMMRIEFSKLQNQNVSEKELERALRFIIGRHDIDLQKTSTLGSTIIYDHIYGVDYRKSLDAKKLYQGITPEQIRRTAQDLFSRPAVVSLVGPGNSLAIR